MPMKYAHMAVRFSTFGVARPEGDYTPRSGITEPSESGVALLRRVWHLFH